METAPPTLTAPVELTLEGALSDSPTFRAALQRNEDQFEELTSILESMVRTIRACLENAAKLSESLNRLSPEVRRLCEVEVFDDNKAPCCVKTMAELIDASHALYEKLIRDFGQKLLIPLIQSVQDDLRDIREVRKSYEKNKERYESTMSKFGAIPKLREFPLIREDAFQLFESRKVYYQQLFAYVIRINKFKMGSDNFFVDKSLASLGEYQEFCSAMGDMVECMRIPAEHMKGQLIEWQKEAKTIAGRLEKDRRERMDQMRNRYSPETPYEQSRGSEKSGYLFKKRSKGISGGWKRVYISITNGNLIQQTHSRRRGMIETLSSVNVLLCEVRLAESLDRRNCFEVYTSQQTNTYQAESEDEMRDWIRVIENAKNQALVAGIQPLPSTDLKGATMRPKNAGMASVQGQGGLQAHSQAQAQSQQQSTEQKDSPLSLLEPSPGEEGTAPVEGEESATLTTAAGTGPALGIANTEPFTTLVDHSYTTSSNTPNQPSSLASTITHGGGTFLKGRLDTAWVGDEFRLLFPQHTLENVFVVFNCMMSSQSKFFGRLFATERNMFFHSNVFGYTSQMIINWTKVAQVVYSTGSFLGLLKITPIASSTPTDFMTFYDETPQVEKLLAMHRNAKSEKPKLAAELYDLLYAMGETSLVRQPSVSEGTSTGRVMAVGGEEAASTEEVRCECEDHLERTELNVILPISLNDLYVMLFGEGHVALLAVHKRLGYQGLQADPWVERGGEEQRELKYVVPISHPLVKAKEAKCEELQRILRKEPGRCYIIRTEASTPQVAYGDSFVTTVKYCLTHYAVGKSRLHTSVGICWLKSPLVKSLIKHTALKGLADFMQAYLECIWEEIRRLNPDAIPLPLPTEEKPPQATKVEGIEEGSVVGGERIMAEQRWIKRIILWMVHLIRHPSSLLGLPQAIQSKLAPAGELLSTKILPITLTRLVGLLLLTTILTFGMGLGIGRMMGEGLKGSNQIGSTAMWSERATPAQQYVSLAQLSNELQAPIPDPFRNGRLDLSSKGAISKEEWFLPRYEGIFHRLAASHHEYDLLRRDLRAILQRLGSMECQVFQAQYVTWLADRLAACYSDTSQPLAHCASLEKAWAGARKEQCNR